MKLADRVKETTTTTGTGTYNLGGAATGYRAFSSAFTTADVVYYCCEDGTDWEVGRGTLTTGTPWTLSRATVLASSNAGAAVDWAAGTRNIFCTAPATVLPIRAWADISISAGVPTVQASLNVTSLTDHAVGEWTITLTSATSSANRASFAAVDHGSLSAYATKIWNSSTTSLRVFCFSGSGFDPTRLYVTTFG